MEKLRTLVDTELSKSEFIRRLNTGINDYVISNVRTALYSDARSIKGLIEEGDQPVSRRKCATGKTVKEKHIDDVWCLVCSIKNSRRVDRVLLKNGKRSKKELELSQKLALVDVAQNVPGFNRYPRACTDSPPTTSPDLTADTLPSTSTASDSSALLSSISTPSATPPEPLTSRPDSPNNLPDGPSASVVLGGNLSTLSTSLSTACQSTPSPTASCAVPEALSTTLDERFFRSTMVGEIRTIQQDLASVKSDLRAVERNSRTLSNSTSISPEANVSGVSVLYVRLKKICDPPLGKLGLEALTKCSILQYVRIGDAAYKIKIETCQLKTIMENSRAGCYFVDTWKSRSAVPSPFSADRCSQYATNGTETLPLKITSWNCRGLASSIPYLNSLISEGSDIIVISEHWLWPFELHRLNEIHPDFTGYGQADARLTSCSDGRGLGGIGVIWRRDLDVSVVHATTSDRICSVRMTHRSSNSTLSVVGVYLPCQDLGMHMDLYRNCLTKLEQLHGDGVKADRPYYCHGRL